ncbi:hypothetical protein P7K49_007959, partial [Saguinus oedipus]
AQKLADPLASSTARTSVSLNSLGSSLSFPYVSQARTPEQVPPCFEQTHSAGWAPASGLTPTVEASGVQPPPFSSLPPKRQAWHCPPSAPSPCGPLGAQALLEGSE